MKSPMKPTEFLFASSIIVGAIVTLCLFVKWADKQGVVRKEQLKERGLQ